LLFHYSPFHIHVLPPCNSNAIVITVWNCLIDLLPTFLPYIAHFEVPHNIQIDLLDFPHTYNHSPQSCSLPHGALIQNIPSPTTSYYHVRSKKPLDRL
jgi:hypothetical protein